MKNSTPFFILSQIICVILFSNCRALKVTPFDVGETTLYAGGYEKHPYSYNFIAPVASDLLCYDGFQLPPILEGPVLISEIESSYCNNPLDYNPQYRNRYFMSVFGPRMRANNGEIKEDYDYHRGADIIDKSIPEGDTPDLLCMCDGIIESIEHEENELYGKSVTIKCAQQFNNGIWGNIYIAYRHLSTISSALILNNPIGKGSIIGKMGKTGRTTTNHLHLSVQRKEGDEFYNVHPSRVFNPTINTHLIRPIDSPPVSKNSKNRKNEQVQVYLLESNSSAIPIANTALFRIVIPYFKANLKTIIISAPGFFEIIDFENISRERDGDEDWLNTNVVGKARLFVFPFNRGQSAFYRYNSIKNDLKRITHSGNDHPIYNTGIFRTESYVLDIKVIALPVNFKKTDLEISLIDVWGNGLKASL